MHNFPQPTMTNCIYISFMMQKQSNNPFRDKGPIYVWYIFLKNLLKKKKKEKEEETNIKIYN